MKKFCLILTAVFSFGLAQAQLSNYETEDGFNKFSVKGVHKSDVMWKKTVTRAIDLREKQNEPIFSKDREITRMIIDAVKAGVIRPYATDSLWEGRALTIDEFLEGIKLPSAEAELSEEEMAFMEEDDDDWGDEEGDEEEAPVSAEADYFFPKDLYQMQVLEDMIFDKQRSVMYYDILAVKMFVPADHADNIKGIEIEIATFSYKELKEKVFKDNPNAIWYNPYNDAEHRTLAEAFELRLFSSYIVKVSNPADEYLTDIYGGDPKTGILASQWKAYELLEFEHNLWEF